MPLPDPSLRYRFASPAGYDLIRKTLHARLPYVPHDYQLEGVAQLLDGNDLVAVLATGSGKTGYYLIYILMLLELSKHPSLCQPPCRPIPKDPCLVVVYPTNGLEEEQAMVFRSAGLTTLVINAGTLEEGRKSGSDLWIVARTGVAVILLSPEQLSSPRFESLLQHSPFQSRVCALGIDEIHLLYSWGQSFRKSFRQLAYVRARFPLGTRLLGTTATLLSGHPEKTILSFMGLREGQFHLIRRSNIRRNVQTIFRTLTRGIGGWMYPDLRWIVAAGRKTVIHCRTIAISFRVAVYLSHLCPSSSDFTKRVRMYNALCWPSYNAETRRLLEEDPEAQIVIATAAFMVGIDIPTIADVVILGNLVSADEHVQWEGRAGRDPARVQDARCITYVTKKTLQTARALLDGNPPKKPSGKTATVQMELSMARLLLAKCVTVEQDLLYNNPPSDPPCCCLRCTSISSSASSHDIPDGSGGCQCSGCRPEEVLPVIPAKRATPNPVPRRQRLTRPMRAEGTRQLGEFRNAVYRTSTVSSAAARALTPDIFLPDSTIKRILDNFALIDTPNVLQEFVSGDLYIHPHQAALWERIESLRSTFTVMREKRDSKKARAAQKKKTSGEGANGGGKAAAATPGEFMVPQLRTLEECSGSFQLEGPAIQGIGTTGSECRTVLEPVDIQWNLVDGTFALTESTVSQGARKRSSTVSTINPRPRAKRRVNAAHEKENVPPHEEETAY